MTKKEVARAAALAARIRAPRPSARPEDTLEYGQLLADLVPGLIDDLHRARARVAKLQAATVQIPTAKVDLACEACAKPFTVYRSHLRTGKHGGRFCSIACGIGQKRTYTPRKKKTL